MPDYLAELEKVGRLLRWDRECAIDYLGLGQVQRLEEMAPEGCLAQETPFGPVMVFLVAGEYRIVLTPVIKEYPDD